MQCIVLKKKKNSQSVSNPVALIDIQSEDQPPSACMLVQGGLLEQGKDH